MVEKDKKKNTQSKKGDPKNIDTTTTLNINDAYDEDEITLKEELPEPKEVEVSSESDEEESSITVKLEKKHTETEISLITKQLQQVEKNIYENEKEFGIFNRILYFFKLCWLICLRFLDAVIKTIKNIPINKRTLIIASAIIGGLIVAAILVLTVKRITKTIKIETKVALPYKKTIKPVKITNLKLSPITHHSLKGDKVDPNNIIVGSTIYLNFHVMDWHVGKNEKLNLSADVRVYTTEGKLELFTPEYMSFIDMADKKKDKILMRTRLALSPDIPPGYYRIVVRVTELSTLRRANLQTRIKVVPEEEIGRMQ